MNILSVENLSKSYGTKPLLSGLSFGVEQGEKIGVIGINGTGKSTFLKILAEQEKPEQGKVIYGNDVFRDYLSQEPLFQAGTTVLEQVFRGSSPVMEILRRYEAALEALARDQEEVSLQNRVISLSQQMDEMGAWQLESEAKAVLTRLGISNFSDKVEHLSGGMRKRIALASALISDADLLILDEPTNHLDYQTVEWLEGYLRGRKGALVMVTHDRYFLDRVVDKIFELDQGKLYVYEGNYTTFLNAKLTRLEQEASAEEKRQNLIRNELKWIRRGAQARSTKQKARIDRFNALVEQSSEAVNDRIEISVASTRLGKKVIELEHVTKRLGGKRVLDDFSYILQRQDRIGIVGPNGFGKSTLLNILTGRLLPDQGTIEIGPTVKIGYFCQENTEMKSEQRLIEYLQEEGEMLETSDGCRISASQMLERFLFPPHMQWNPIGTLSGGEKRRLFLVRVLMGAPNVILLDEPTNDLDIQTLTILEDYLESFAGAVIAVSHDRYFLDRMSNKIFAFEPEGKVSQYVGNYSDYMEQIKNTLALKTEQGGSVKVQKESGKKQEQATKGESIDSQEPNAKEKAKAPKFSFKEQREYEMIDRTIEQTEQLLAEINENINQAGSNYALLQDLVKQQQTTEGELERLMERWTYLNELAEKIEQHKKQY